MLSVVAVPLHGTNDTEQPLTGRDGDDLEAQLEERLGALLSRLDPVPESVREAARAAYLRRRDARDPDATDGRDLPKA